jgi:hypothetical protein
MARHRSTLGELIERSDARQRERVIERLAVACYHAQWDGDLPKPGSIDHALAMQIGRAAYDEISSMVYEYSLFGAIK